MHSRMNHYHKNVLNMSVDTVKKPEKVKTHTYSCLKTHMLAFKSTIMIAIHATVILVTVYRGNYN